MWLIGFHRRLAVWPAGKWGGMSPENTPHPPCIIAQRVSGPYSGLLALRLGWPRPTPSRRCDGHLAASPAHAVPSGSTAGRIPATPPTPDPPVRATRATRALHSIPLIHRPHTSHKAPPPIFPHKCSKNDISIGKHRAETPMGVANRPPLYILIDGIKHCTRCG